MPNPWTTTASRNRFSALDLESDSEPESDPDPLSRSHFGGEPTIPLYFGTFEQNPELEDEEEPVSIEPQTPELTKTWTPETESSADYLSAEERIETWTQLKSSYLNKRAEQIIKAIIRMKLKTETKNEMASTKRMIIDSEKKPSELKPFQLKPFTGKWTEFDGFLQDVKLYLNINEDIYNTDKKKIGYSLSFINEDDAKFWKGQFIQNAQGPTGLDLRTWTQFVKELTNAFQPYDAPGDAIENITNMKMGNNTIEDHTAWF